MVPKGIKLDMKDLKQQAAMPLDNFLRHDPWSDQLIQMQSTIEPLLSDRDKMPFEVTPVYMKLSYFASATPAAAPGTPAPASGTQAPTNAPPPNTNATPAAQQAAPAAAPAAKPAAVPAQ